ncbi:hypothetical protein PX554_03565 [Sphingomonas sp. H39-1-10]|uniref:hypothetical protein n=1 Tax=Sphingomonas TaxID=13687 RepID=UPI00087FBEA1|nr:MULTISPECIES: hypothetical protein [Sphingomonas]MDF0487197.1 hypothetical protein [Sphingomonas pollutisoli]SDA14043.1 hypothetical protein SAMN03159340_00501 [Sphingomonas sp. NFR15]
MATLSYTRFADLIVNAPTIVDAAIRSVAPIKGPAAADVRPGYARVYIEADVAALIRAPGALPPTIGYVADVPLDARGRMPKLRKLRVLLFARPARQPGQIQLVALDGQRDWSPEADALTRRIATEVVAAGAPPAITGVGHAFHTPGALPGEGETQIFLTTADGSPVSLNIVRKQGEPPHWSASIGDLADPNAAAPQHDTLLWYRLACGLPTALPDSSTAGIDPSEADIAREDYKVVLDSLGRCDR